MRVWGTERDKRRAVPGILMDCVIREMNNTKGRVGQVGSYSYGVPSLEPIRNYRGVTDILMGCECHQTTYLLTYSTSSGLPQATEGILIHTPLRLTHSFPVLTSLTQLGHTGPDLL